MFSCNKETGSSNVNLESVELYPAELEVKLGKTIRAEPKFTPISYTPQRLPEWTSSDASILQVDKTGLITALKLGSANITMVVEGKSATSKVTVLESDPVVPKPNPAPLLEIRPGALLISVENKGTKVPLKLIVSPESSDISALKWESSRPEIVTVDNSGIITIVGKQGFSTISASLNTFVNASCSVYVLNE